jgi:hypothetical protein
MPQSYVMTRHDDRWTRLYRVFLICVRRRRRISTLGKSGNANPLSFCKRMKSAGSPPWTLDDGIQGIGPSMPELAVRLRKPSIREQRKSRSQFSPREPHRFRKTPTHLPPAQSGTQSRRDLFAPLKVTLIAVGYYSGGIVGDRPCR